MTLATGVENDGFYSTRSVRRVQFGVDGELV